MSEVIDTTQQKINKTVNMLVFFTLIVFHSEILDLKV
jgi:hypothetical protein